MKTTPTMIVTLTVLLATSLSLLIATDLHAGEIHEAVTAGDLDKVRALIEADPTLLESKDNNGHTPLNFNCTKQSLEVIKLKQEIVQAIQQNNMAVVDSLLINEPDQLLARDKQGVSALHFAARYNKPEIVKLLINKGVDVNIKDDDNSTPLHEATQNGHKEVVRILLDNNANVKAVTKRDQVIPLHRACWQGDKEIVNWLLEKDSHVNLTSTFNNTPLHKAALKGYLEIAQLLIKHGAKINKRNLYGETPLHRAARHGHVEMCELLLTHGADYHLTRNDGTIPLHAAIEAEQPDVIDLLKRHGAKDTPVQFPKLTGYYLDQKPPGKRAEVFAPGIISIQHTEHSAPAFSPDGNEICWNSGWRSKTNVPQLVIISMQRVNGFWTRPQITSFSKKTYSGAHRDFGSQFSKDGKMLIFQSKRLIPEQEDIETPIPQRPMRIWAVEKRESGWGEPYLMKFGGELNTTGFSPFVTRDGSIYFSDMKNLLYSEFQNGEYLKPEKSDLNALNIGFGFCISPDEQFIIFSSGKLEGHGSGDLYICFKNEDGKWTEPKNMGPEINTWSQERCPGLSPDGKYLFFTRYNLEGQHDIYWIDAEVIDELKKENMK